ncbi:MAG: crossover junction endodeoxyribonuclease RuvC [Kordiimonadaceae bacterium]|nr:crossover junction endodeoxyribonuclease RuvC [Kordiimonadaceae bacterium]MBT6032179.1 crossover junction endodeoxyribonuclease RuvC [Kordiimonadaceae bacterium]
MSVKRQRLIGFDPGLRKTGWGIIDVEGSRLIHVANGIVKTDNALSLAERLVQLYDGLTQVVTDWEPISAAVEETFVNKNPNSTLKLGQARGISLLVPALAGLPVAEYSPNHIKKSVVGAGHAGKEQVKAMLGILLPGVKINGEDAGDALAVAICHAHSGGAHGRLSDALQKAGGGSNRAGAQIIMKGTR